MAEPNGNTDTSTQAQTNLESARQETDEALNAEVEAAQEVEEEREQAAEEAATEISGEVEASAQRVEAAEVEAAEEIREEIDDAAEDAAQETGASEAEMEERIIAKLIERGVIPSPETTNEVDTSNAPSEVNISVGENVASVDSAVVEESAVEPEVAPQSAHPYYKERNFNGLWKRVLGIGK